MALSAGAVRFQAVLFDLDGVLTATARVHQAAWKETFDTFLEQRAARTGEPFQPFTADDYLRFVDGKLREEGVRSFLHARGIDLPDEAPPSDTPNSVRSLAARKNESMARFLRPDAIEVFPGSLAVVRALRARGMKTAVVSSSSNCRAVLAVTKLGELFDAVVEGTVAAELGLRGKPAPDTFLEAARRLAVPPESAVVVEDAVAGVRAAREGGFGLVIGVDRHGNARALRQAGAHLVVADLWELIAGLESGHHGPKLHRLLEIARNIAAGEHVIHQEAWKLVVHKPAPELAPQVESMLALSNGYLGIRGSTEEGAPRFHSATLLNGFHETWPIVYPEHAYGFARTGQTILNVCDGSCIQLFAEGELLDPVQHDIAAYERSLLLDRGLLERTLVWRLASGARIAVRSQRLVSLRDRHLTCIVYEIEALDGPVSVTLCSLFAEARALQTYDEIVDPRRRVWTEALRRESRELTANGVLCTYATKSSGQHLACGMAHQLLGADAPELSVREEPELTRYTVSTQLVPGRAVRLEKFLAYHYAGGEAARDMRYRAEQTLAHACRAGAPQIIAQQDAAMREFWLDADVELVGNTGLQFALRYNIFQLMQATARSEGHGVPAKGLTGEGYEGHYFWDSEIYVLPFLIYTRPKLARELLLHRYTMLDHARARARELGLRGALFPWRTINGEEASPSYASGTAQYHINADIAFALRKYVEVTGDRAFLRQFGAEILVETARFWLDLGFFSKRKDDQFVINGVTGPDEYTTVVDNNAFTNLMARENMLIAVRVLETLQREDPDGYDHVLTATQLAAGEPESWQRAADAMYVPYDEEAQVHLQDDTFLDQEPWDFRATPPEQYPLLLHFHPLTLYRHQVIKQADVMLACFLLGNYFSAHEKRRIFDYYDPLTTGDSSLSECIQCIVACEVGEVAVAHRYLMGSATTDLADLHKNVRDGMHIASAGGTWMAVVYGFAGLRDYGGALSFKPSLPPHWQKLRFRLRVRDSLLEVEFGPSSAVYRLLKGSGLVLSHRGERISLARGEEHRLHDPQMAPERWTESQAAAAASDSLLARADAAAE